MLFFSGRISDLICSFRLPKDGMLLKCVITLFQEVIASGKKTVHISKSFTPYFMKSITIILTVQWSAG